MQHLLTSVLGCHLLGSALCVLLVIAISLVWYHRSVVVTHVNHGDTAIDVMEASELITQADNWRKKYTMTFRESQAIDARVVAIDRWLPRQANWDATRQHIRSLAKTAEVNIVSLNEDGRHVGVRVGADAATCRVTGSYSNICRFLADLANGANPIACRELMLQRIPARHDDEDPQPACSATLSLRLPFAVKGSIAQKLFSESKNAI